MPAGDRTGPQGMGPQTGRGMGFCAGNDMPGYMHSGYGYRGAPRRFSRMGGRGYRRGFRATGQPGWARFQDFGWGYPPEPIPVSPEEEKEMLQDQEKWLKEQLAAVQGRLTEEPKE